MGVKLGKLKRTGVRRIVKFTDEYDNTQEIKIFEPDEELTEKLSEVLLRHSDVNSDEIKIKLPQNVVITEFLKVLTDIELPESQEDINEVIENPCLPFQKVLTEIVSMVTELMEVNIKTLKTLNRMSDVGDMSQEEALGLVKIQKEILEAKEQVKQEGIDTCELNVKENLEEEIEKTRAKRFSEKDKIKEKSVDTVNEEN